MDCFKTKPQIEKIYSISDNNYYAVCPECDNPIQIIGLFKNTVEAGKKPYGRHNKGSIPNLAKYCEDDYLMCSYSKTIWKKSFTVPNKRSHNSEIAKRNLALMKAQFDRVIYLLSKDIDIDISYDLAREMLISYIADEGWLYRTATMNNLPWTLLETCCAIKLFGRKILRNSDLHKALQKKCDNLRFEGEENNKYVKVLNRTKTDFIDLSFIFCNHKKTLVEGRLVETIVFSVSQGNAPNIVEIYKKKIEINTSYFLNHIVELVALADEKSNRNYNYLNIANELIH